MSRLQENLFSQNKALVGVSVRHQVLLAWGIVHVCIQSICEDIKMQEHFINYILVLKFFQKDEKSHRPAILAVVLLPKPNVNLKFDKGF